MSGDPGIGLPSTDRPNIKLVLSGRAFFDLLTELINGAKSSIHIQTYIFSEDETGRSIAFALENAARRGIEVHLLVDGYASMDLSKSFIYQLKEAGVQFRMFEPLVKSKYGYFGRRLHHKLAVIDQKHALVGGINISNNYNDLPSNPAWLDFALYLQGEIARELCILCWKTWYSFPRKMGLTPCEEDQQRGEKPATQDSTVTFLRNDWVRRKNEIFKAYNELFKGAERELMVLSSYFLPGKVFRNHLRAAARRGVRVRIILAERSDVVLSKYAERHIYQWLLRNGIEVYEYNRNVLHGKLAIADGRELTLGSFNVNNISTFASIELNLWVHDADLISECMNVLEAIIQNDCQRITMEDYQNRFGGWSQLWQRISYDLVRFMFFISTFYFRQRE